MISTTDRLGRRRDFSFNAAGQKIGEQWVESGSTVAYLTFTYDAAGNQLTAQNANGTYTLTYDGLNRVVHVDEPFGVGLTFTYDAVGDRTLVEDSLGGITTSTYDAKGQLTRRDFSDGTSALRVDITRDELGRESTETRYSDLAGNNLVARTTYTYTAAGKVETIHHTDAGSNNLANYTYTYDAHRRLTAEVLNGTATTYSYDSADQVTADGTTTVTYDANGNRNNGSYSTSTGNQLTTDGTWNYSYDAEGNQVKKVNIATGQTFTYGFDHRNQLTWVEVRTTDEGTLEKRVEYKYDALNNRIEKTVDANGDSTVDSTQRYALDGWKNLGAAPIGNEAFDVWADLDGSGSLTTRYIRDDVTDKLFARVAQTGEEFWLLGDHLGSVRQVIDNSAQVKSSLTYNAFGEVIGETDPSSSGRYGWTSREREIEIDLQYNRARYYDPKTARWISRDPLGFDAGDSNLYRYVRNYSTGATDPSGLQWGTPVLPGGYSGLGGQGQGPVSPLSSGVGGFGGLGGSGGPVYSPQQMSKGQKITVPANIKEIIAQERKRSEEAERAQKERAQLEVAAMTKFHNAKGLVEKQLPTGDYVSLVELGNYTAAIYYRKEPFNLWMDLGSPQAFGLDGVAKGNIEAARQLTGKISSSLIGIEGLSKGFNVDAHKERLELQKTIAQLLVGIPGKLNVVNKVGLWGKGTSLDLVVRSNELKYDSENNAAANLLKAPIPIWQTAVKFERGIYHWERGEFDLAFANLGEGVLSFADDVSLVLMGWSGAKAMLKRARANGPEILGVIGDADAPLVAAARNDRVLQALYDLAPGERLIVTGHGSPTRLEFLGRRLTATEFAEIIERMPVRPGSIEIVACRSASAPPSGGLSFAETVANLTGIPVTGYDAMIYVGEHSGQAGQVLLSETGPISRFLYRLGAFRSPYRPAWYNPRPAAPITFGNQ